MNEDRDPTFSPRLKLELQPRGSEKNTKTVSTVYAHLDLCPVLFILKHIIFCYKLTFKLNSLSLNGSEEVDYIYFLAIKERITSIKSYLTIQL